MKKTCDAFKKRILLKIPFLLKRYSAKKSQLKKLSRFRCLATFVRAKTKTKKHVGVILIMLKYGFCRRPSWDRGKGFGFGFGLIGGGGGLDKQAGVESGVRETMLKNSPIHSGLGSNLLRARIFGKNLRKYEIKIETF